MSSMDSMYEAGDSLWSKATFSSTDAGRNQRVFGEVMWQQSNVQTPVFGMLPKMTADSAPSNIADPRPMSYRAVFNPPTYDATGEAGAWGTPVDFDTREVEIDPRHSTMRFEGSLLQEVFADIQDGVPLESITQIGEEYFQRSLEADGITRGVSASTNGGTAYSAENRITTLDRVVGSADEEANATGIGGTAFGGGELDIYNIDRSATGAGGDNEANWADAVVDHNSGGGDRQLTKDLVNQVVERLEGNGTKRENLTIVTGHDTARVLSELTESTFRADAMADAVSQAVDRGTDDAEARSGVSYNTQVGEFEQMPVVAGPHMPSDSLSRMFLLDMTQMQDPTTGKNIPKLGIETYIPMTVETAGLGQDTNTLALGNLVEQQGLLTTHQIRCNRFNHQAKVRDLAE